MANPIDLIRDGIETVSWEKVVQGFAMLTGERLAPPQEQPADHAAISFLNELEWRIKKFLAYEAPEDEATDEELDEEDDEPPHVIELLERLEDEDKLNTERRPPMEWEDEPGEGHASATEANEIPEKPEPASPVEARARELRETRDNPTGQFAIEHKGEAMTDDGKGKPCRVLPPDTGKHKNKFKDTREMAAAEIKESRQLSKSFQGKEKRDDHKMVKATCSKCDREEEVHPDNAPRVLDGEATAYVCNRCIRSSVR